ncbi:hypothetical protein Tco_1022802, partial [Tanacetum coccineum]
MASLDHRLNPLFSIKECMSYGALYTRNCGCSKGSLEDKILVPKNRHHLKYHHRTDNTKISSKRSKPDKHGHGNRIECAKAGRMLSK